MTTRAARAAAACIIANGATSTPCWLCGRVINYALAKKHHLAAVAYLVGGDPTEPANLAPTHRECHDKASQRTSREW